MQISYETNIFNLIKKAVRAAHRQGQVIKEFELTESEAETLFDALSAKPQYQNDIPDNLVDWLALLRNESEDFELFGEKVICEAI